MLDASSDPAAPPAPTKVWSSSIKRITSGFFSSSFITAFIRSSNCPRYFVPATNEPRSRVTTRLSNRMLGTWRRTMRKARPSTMADLPTPGSPMSSGLFFFRRERIWQTRSISRVRPTTGSSLSSRARWVRSRPKLSSTGVLLLGARGSPSRTEACGVKDEWSSCSSSE